MYLTSIILSALVVGGNLVGAVPAELVKRADLKGFDISSAKSSSFWSCAKSNGYTKPVIRGYQQACGHVRQPRSLGPLKKEAG